MSTIEITLTKDYVPDWKMYEGIRELIQNARDGETEFGARMEVQYRPKTQTLAIKNHGVAIPKEALLIGFSTKRDKEHLIGQFGEGLNLGLLALVRAGMNVTIRSADEVWKPVIEKSSKFDAYVLKIKVSKASVLKHRTSIEVSPISEENWNELKTLFLFLADKDDPRLQPEQIIQVTSGRVLLHPELAGMLFVKGIFVDRIPKISKGYDLNSCKVDRDRKMVDSWDMKWQTSKMWNEAITQQLVASCVVYEMLEREQEEVEQLAYSAGRTTIQKIAENFKIKHGEKATPVENLAQSKEVEHFGQTGVVVSKSLGKMLELEFGNYETRKQELVRSTVHLFSWQDLDLHEKDNLTVVIELIEEILGKIDLINYIDVVEFQDNGTLGLYKSKEKRIYLSRKILLDKAKLLAITAHETLHSIGSDGNALFHHSVEELLAQIAIKQWDKTQ